LKAGRQAGKQEKRWTTSQTFASKIPQKTHVKRHERQPAFNRAFKLWNKTLGQKTLQYQPQPQFTAKYCNVRIRT
jgi:hypothetical protein